MVSGEGFVQIEKGKIEKRNQRGAKCVKEIKTRGRRRAGVGESWE